MCREETPEMPVGQREERPVGRTKKSLDRVARWIRSRARVIRKAWTCCLSRQESTTVPTWHTDWTTLDLQPGTLDHNDRCGEKCTEPSEDIETMSSESFSQGYRSLSSSSSPWPSPDASGGHFLIEMAKNNFTSISKALLDICLTCWTDKYVQQEPLGNGGYGTIFGGYRTADGLPVAIKYISKEQVPYTEVTVNGNLLRIPTEVLLQRIVAGTSVGESAAVTLLDWVDLGQQVVLVLERPVPCMDLYQYLMKRGGSLSEHEAKTIIKQLVDALMDFHHKGVVHRDIKMENILVQTGSHAPVIRVIDFGRSCAETDEEYTNMAGTLDGFPPEFFERSSYRAVPYSVWQLGVVMYTIIFGHFPFDLDNDTSFQEPQMNTEHLSQCGRDFLKHCLVKDPASRATLQDLFYHPWINVNSL